MVVNGVKPSVDAMHSCYSDDLTLSGKNQGLLKVDELSMCLTNSPHDFLVDGVVSMKWGDEFPACCSANFSIFVRKEWMFGNDMNPSLICLNIEIYKMLKIGTCVRLYV